MRDLARRLAAMEQIEQARQQAEREHLAALWAPFWAAFSDTDLELLATHPALAGPVTADDLTVEHWRVADLWYQRLYALLCAVRPFFAGAVPRTHTEQQDLARVHAYLDHWAATYATDRPTQPIDLLTWLDTTIADLDPRLPVAVRAGLAPTEGAHDAPTLL